MVEAVQVEFEPQLMYNLTVDVAHTFFVGDEQWLVHNANRGRNYAGCPLTGVVEFEIPSWATPQEAQQVRDYVAGCNAALAACALSPTGRVRTAGNLERAAGNAASRENRRARRAGTPYVGVAGHVPDSTWNGRPDPHSWMDLTRRINGSLASQSRNYPLGFKPTGFKVK